ncbi:hypothetical protein FNV43_RR05511 [Rhamnella rubrinervis]|uniref:Disease resistance protein At4g27190-like leucine-rich repeats domain-containing protein n=1 Tax=Rhamnella rubrinervis TaxID=2594499 RepID=A0A8K0MRA6_9ROSA|nr:hypothetical protein FNV43_RR05511 [Rhamnella rubrinervis]
MRQSFSGCSPVQENKEKSCASLDELTHLSDRLKVLDIYVPQVQLLPQNFVLKNLTRFRICICFDRWIVSQSFLFENILRFDRWNESRSYLFENILCFKGDYRTDALIESGINLLVNKCEKLELQGYQKNFNQLHEVGFSMLKIFRLFECRGVEYLMDSNSKWTDNQVPFPVLEKLYVDQTSLNEGIVYKESWENDDNIADDTIVFPALTTLTLNLLQRLISLYSSHEVQKSSSKSTPTFVPCKCIKWLPKLEKLEITSCPTIRVVFDFHGLVMPLPEKGKANSKLVVVHEKKEDQRHWCLKCIPARKDKTVQGNNATTSSHPDAQRKARSTGRDDGLVRESPYPYGDYNMNGTDKKPVFHNLNSLEVFACDSVFVIFDFGESQGLFPPILNNLSEMRLGYLPELMHIWNIKKGPQQLVFKSGFQNLRTLHIEGCAKLTNIFSASIAKLLVMLEQMEIECCGSLQVIVAKEEEENVQDVVMSFPYLRSISLKKQGNLSCFSDQPNCAFRFPSLEKILIKDCYKLEKFVTAAAATSAEDIPKLKQVEDRDLPPLQRNNWLRNLNTTIQYNFQLKQVRQKENPKKKEVLIEADRRSNTTADNPPLFDSVHTVCTKVECPSEYDVHWCVLELRVLLNVDQLRYLIFCEGSIKAPEEELEKLKDKRAEIQLAMEAATRKLQVIAPQVIRWVSDVHENANKLETLLKEDVKPDKMQFNGWFPNLKLRHSLGRKAKNTLVVLKLQQGKVDKISYPAPPTGMPLEPSMKAFDSRAEILKQVMEAPMDENVHLIAI